MNPMMDLQQAHGWIPGSHLVGAGSTAIVRVHTDTRTIEPGDLFVALKGDSFDANDFLQEAKRKGASAAITHSKAQMDAAGLPGLVVTDTRAALGQLASSWRSQFKLPLIAVTGSNGKTTVTQMIASILRTYRPDTMLATQGNFNNDIGVPLTLLRLRPEHEIAVLELGMNHPGEIARLAAMAQATVALVNNAQREHLEFMDTVEAVARENGAVIATLPSRGVAVIPLDDSFSGLWQALAGQRPQLSFEDASPRAGAQTGLTPSGNARPDKASPADVVCTACAWAHGAWAVKANTPAGAIEFALQIAGRHNVKNALAAVACTLAAGVPLADITGGLEAFEAVKGRSRALGRVLDGHGITLVDDTYNANPDSVRAAIDVLADLPGPRLLVLGDMGEVGNQGPKFHAEVGAYARERGIEQLLALGELSSHACQAFGSGQHFANLEGLKQAVMAALSGCHSVLVKGSRFMKMERVVEAISASTQPLQAMPRQAPWPAVQVKVAQKEGTPCS